MLLRARRNQPLCMRVSARPETLLSRSTFSVVHIYIVIEASLCLYIHDHRQCISVSVYTRPDSASLCLYIYATTDSASVCLYIHDRRQCISVSVYTRPQTVHQCVCKYTTSDIASVCVYIHGCRQCISVSVYTRPQTVPYLAPPSLQTT